MIGVLSSWAALAALVAVVSAWAGHSAGSRASAVLRSYPRPGGGA